MALTFSELEAITNDYFLADGKKAVDIYFNDSFLLDFLMNKRKGMWERPPGGKTIKIPLSFDGANGGAYVRAEPLVSDDRESANAAYFNWKHYYANATIYRTDELSNAGEYAEVALVVQRVEAAQKQVRKDLATDMYAAASDTAKTLTGLKSCCGSSTSTNYGGLAEADLVAADGTKPWRGNAYGTAQAISLAVIRTTCSSAKIGDGRDGKPNIGVMPEALFNIVSGILQNQQRFTQDTDTANAGFTNVVFEGKILASDDYCPSGYLFVLNTNHFGFAVHPQGFFARDPWAKLVGPAGKTMKIFWDGNLICNHRAAQGSAASLS